MGFSPEIEIVINTEDELDGDYEDPAALDPDAIRGPLGLEVAPDGVGPYPGHSCLEVG